MKMSGISREVHQIKWNICHFVAKYMYFDIPKYLFPKLRFSVLPSDIYDRWMPELAKF